MMSIDNSKVTINNFNMQGLKNIPKVYEFVERKNGGQNFIVMKLLGKNLAVLKKQLGRKLTIDLSINILVIFSILNIYLAVNALIYSGCP